MITKNAQWQFVHSEILTLSVMAAFARARIYVPGADEQARRSLHTTLKQTLVRVGLQYKAVVTESEHLQNIGAIASAVSKEHAAILVGHAFRIGTAQKALNLYLKYLWCLGQLPEPPHCPVDAVILACVPAANRVPWTQIATLEEYMRCITAIRKLTNGQSLAQWECTQWNEAQQGAAR